MGWGLFPPDEWYIPRSLVFYKCIIYSQYTQYIWYICNMPGHYSSSSWTNWNLRWATDCCPPTSRSRWCPPSRRVRWEVGLVILNLVIPVILVIVIFVIVTLVFVLLVIIDYFSGLRHLAIWKAFVFFWLLSYLPLSPCPPYHHWLFRRSSACGEVI